MHRACRIATTISCGVAALVVVAASAAAADTTRYVLFTSDGQRGGEQVVERGDDGWTTVRFVFKTNGRGPELVERVRLAGDGTPTDYTVTGRATMGAPIDERFSRSGTTARWESKTERGTKAVDGPALYVPLHSSFHFASIGMAALAARADGSLALLPSGRLTQRKLDEVEVRRGSETRRVQLIAQSGIGFTPSFYWATTGPQPRLFAVVIPGWLRGVEEGWDASLDTLGARQRAAETVLLKAMAGELRHPLHGLTVVRNARVFDSENARLGPASDVYVLRGRITAVVPAGALGRQADQEIDAAGRVMLPGLFDMHAHIDPWDGGLHLAAGVTTVRDMGNDNTKMQYLLDQLAAGQLLVPHIVPCGFLEGHSAYAMRSMGFVVKTAQEARDAVDWYAARGYPQIKIYNSFPRELLPEIVAYAHQRGLRVSGHVPAFMRAQEVVEQGFDEIQHINQVLLNFLVTPTTDTRTLERFYLPAAGLADIDFDAPRVRDFVALLQRRQTVIDPTLITFEWFQQRDGEVTPSYVPVIDHMPPDIQRVFHQGSMNIPDDATAARYKASYAKMVEFVGRLHRAGVPLVAGTDGWAGFTLHSELALYVKAGLTPAQALQIGTWNAARFTRTGAERGSIAVGKLADLVLVDGDPTTDIADLRKVALVITQGQLIAPAEVHRALGITPFVKDTPVLRSLH